MIEFYIDTNLYTRRFENGVPARTTYSEYPDVARDSVLATFRLAGCWPTSQLALCHFAIGQQKNCCYTLPCLSRTTVHYSLRRLQAYLSLFTFQLRLKQQQLRLVTVTGTGRKNLMFDYEGISGSAVIGA